MEASGAHWVLISNMHLRVLLILYSTFSSLARMRECVLFELGLYVRAHKLLPSLRIVVHHCLLLLYHFKSCCSPRI